MMDVVQKPSVWRLFFGVFQPSMHKHSSPVKYRRSCNNCLLWIPVPHRFFYTYIDSTTSKGLNSSQRSWSSCSAERSRKSRCQPPAPHPHAPPPPFKDPNSFKATPPFPILSLSSQSPTIFQWPHLNLQSAHWCLFLLYICIEIAAVLFR